MKTVENGEKVMNPAGLRGGKNVFAVQVLYNDPDIARDQTDERAAIYGVAGAGNSHALAVEGIIQDGNGKSIGSVFFSIFIFII